MRPHIFLITINQSVHGAISVRWSETEREMAKHHVRVPNKLEINCFQLPLQAYKQKKKSKKKLINPSSLYSIAHTQNTNFIRHVCCWKKILNSDCLLIGLHLSHFSLLSKTRENSCTCTKPCAPWSMLVFSSPFFHCCLIQSHRLPEQVKSAKNFPTVWEQIQRPEPFLRAGHLSVLFGVC